MKEFGCNETDSSKSKVIGIFKNGQKCDLLFSIDSQICFIDFKVYYPEREEIYNTWLSVDIKLMFRSLCLREN